MSNKQITLKKYLQSTEVQKRAEELLKDRASAFMTSLISITNADSKLAECDPASLFTACLTAASLDLPVNKNLGFAHIVPYKGVAQFQIGWKGFVQLAQRSNQYKTINATKVYEGQIKDNNPLMGLVFDWNNKTSDDVVGYVAMFQLLNGFEKQLYMSVDELKKHAKQYSQSYKNGKGVWVDNFDAMAIKTVIKLLISKYGAMSTELEKAIVSDQAEIKDDGEVRYVDAEVIHMTQEQEDVILDEITIEDIP